MKTAAAAVVFLITLGIAIPSSSGRERSAAVAMATTRSSGVLANAEKDYWEFLQKRSLVLRLRLGLPIEELPDLSEARAHADALYGAELLQKLRGLREIELSHEESLSLAMLREEARGLLDSQRDYWLTFPVTPYASPERVVHQVFTSWRFRTPEDLDRYASLLTRYAAFIRQMEEKLRAQARRGIRLPKAEISPVAETYRAAIAEPADSLFFVPPGRLEQEADQDRGPFTKRVEGLISSRINPALESLASYVSGDYATKAPSTVGLAQYPGGRAYYQRLVRFHTTLDVMPEEIHRLGLAEVDRLNGELGEVQAAVGFDGTLAEFRRHLRSDPRFVPATPDEIGERLLAAQKRIETKIPLYFGKTPSAPAGIRAATTTTTARRSRTGRSSPPPRSSTTSSSRDITSSGRSRTRIPTFRASEGKRPGPPIPRVGANTRPRSRAKWECTKIRTTARAVFRWTRSSPRGSSWTPG